MSFLLTLEDDKLDDIIPILEKYELIANKSEPIFDLTGKRLVDIAKTLPHYQSSYDENYQELKSLEDWLNNLKDKKIAKHWKRYLESYSRTLSARDIQAYINGEKDIVDINQILIEVSLLKNKFFSIVDALKQLGWMLGHITKLKIAEMEDTIV